MIATLPPEMQARFANPPRAAVTRVLRDGEVLDLVGGVKVVATPGQTVGHLNLFLVRDGVLITGDAMTSAGGQLNGPVERGAAADAHGRRRDHLNVSRSGVVRRPTARPRAGRLRSRSVQ